MTKPPTTRVNLDKAIERLFGSYEEKGHTPVLPTVDEAIAWANDLIRRIATAQ